MPGSSARRIAQRRLAAEIEVFALEDANRRRHFETAGELGAGGDDHLLVVGQQVELCLQLDGLASFDSHGDRGIALHRAFELEDVASGWNRHEFEGTFGIHLNPPAQRQQGGLGATGRLPARVDRAAANRAGGLSERGWRGKKGDGKPRSDDYGRVLEQRASSTDDQTS